MNKDLSRFSVPAFFLFIFIKAFAGPIGMITPFINYIGVIVMFVLLMIRWVRKLLVNSVLLWLSLLFVIYIFIGFMYSAIPQVLFSIYIFIPFLFCIAYSDELVNKVIFGSTKIFAFLGITCALGILYVDKFGAPWLGNVLNIGGLDKVLSRDWTASGVLRNPGFTAASFDAATLLMTCSFFLLYHFKEKKNFVMYIIISVFMVYPIYLTTTKTTIITYSILVFIMLFPALITNYFSKALIFFSVIFSYFYMLPNKIHETYDLANTFFIRMFSTWPDAISLLNDNFSMFFGKGFGGIGTPALIFSPKEYNPADNILVYLYVIGGVTSVILTMTFLFKYFFSNFYDYNFKRKYYLFSFCILIGGLTYNLFESVFYGPFLGIVISVVLNKKYCAMQKLNSSYR